MLSKWGQRFSPLSLFAAGEQGGWWDPSDFGTMFQDSAGTTPVTAVGQPVGLIRDKSGRGNHRTQGTAASRPTLQQDASGFFYLSYDGVDDWMTTGSIDFSGTAKMAAIAGLFKASDAAFSIFFELSASADTNAGTFYIAAPLGAAGNNVAGAMHANGTIQGVNSGAIHAAPVGVIAAHQSDLSAPSQSLRTNGVDRASSTTSAGTGNYGNYPLFFGRRAGTTSPFTGREYQTIIRGAASTAAQIALAERFVGSRMGIVL